MNVFEYLEEEHNKIEEQLNTLIKSYSNLNRDEIFDQVKLICDEIQAHLQKEHTLLIAPFEKNQIAQPFLEDCRSDREQLSEEIGQLVMVHVDEPAYNQCLANLENKFKEHITSEHKFFKDINCALPEFKIESLNKELDNLIHNITDINLIQSEKVEKTHSPASP